MTLKVIGVGFGRTGTLSLKIALERLGLGPCQHWVELTRHPSLARRWVDALRNLHNARPVDWDIVFQGYKSTVDWPGCSFASELKQAYPDAKIILTTRDPDSWYESVSQTLLPLYQSLPTWLCLLLPPLGALRYLASEIIWAENGVFEGQFEDRVKAIEVFEAHNQKVREAFPPNDVLVFDVSDGYGPLCDFLGLTAPDTAFPHVNDCASIQRQVRLFNGTRRVLIAMLLVSVPGFLYWIT